jgi:exodeoxyribonuclease V alpha subunit|tara:strand:+ start:7350 stop:9092 length:1743 start_codon:yes stop_codon:yes gene_type:complete
MNYWEEAVANLHGALFEHHFLRLISSKTGQIAPGARRLMAQLVTATVNQHSCLDLTREDLALIQQLRAEASVGGPEDEKPFVLSHNKLYLSRFYHYESEVAALIRARNEALDIPDANLLTQKLEQHFGATENNRQKLAAFLAIARKLAIITGGPGTGKTSTVVKILDILLEESPDLVIKLVAPTGKAAMRLSESINEWADSRGKKFQVQTLHRLLGMRKDGRTWRHGPKDQVKVDLLIVDEASMIDLTMMHRLLGALPDHTRLILLGDPNQLPSVDTGNVLADLCAGETGFSDTFSALAANFVGEVQTIKRPHHLTDAVCELDKSYRFDPDSGIAKLAKAVQSGHSETRFIDNGVVFKSGEREQVRLDLLVYWKDYIDLLVGKQFNPELLISTFEQTRILCSRRGGEAGVETINHDIESALEIQGVKSPDNEFYAGRPILITQNDYNLGLFNGDIGICTPIKNSDEFIVSFPGASEPLLVSRLPKHESCFAMTVHKAQGSEFDQVILALSEEASDDAASLLTRELLYTAITRAKKSIIIHCNTQVWESAVAQSSRRVSGMTQFLGFEDDSKLAVAQAELF